jgi:hypothetical protein
MAFDFSGIVKASGSDQIAKLLIRLPIPFLRKDYSINFGRLAVTTSWSRILAGCSAQTSLVIGRCPDQGFVHTHAAFCRSTLENVTPRAPNALGGCRTTPVQTRFRNMYDGAFAIGGIAPWVSPPDIRIGDWNVIVDPSAIADRARRKARQRAATGAPARIDAPAATAENSRTRKVRGVARRAGASQRAMAHARQTGYRLGPL